MILIPSPNVTHDHQTKNAYEFTKDGCVVAIAENDLTPERLITTIEDILQTNKINEMKSNISQLDIFSFEEKFNKLLIKVKIKGVTHEPE